MNVELGISYVGLMGQGVAHDEMGNIYFVPGAIPGDRVLAQTEQTEKKYRDAELLEVLTPSEDRCEAPCPVFAECGGCDWMHWKYASQLKAKQTVLQHVIERSGWLPEKVLPALAAENPLGYRNRIQLHGAGKRLGFYKRRSHDIVDIENCPVAHPKINEKLKELRSQPNDGKSRKIELALQPDGTVKVLENQAHAASGFAQVNDEQNAVLKKLVGDYVRGSGAQSVLELFAGNGNLTFAYLDDVAEVFAVDSSAVALAEARQAFGSREKTRGAFIEANIDSKFSRRLPRDFRERYDTLLLDPPRAGAEACIQPLVHDGLKTVIYVSCSPVAFTRDVQCLKESFRFEHIQIIDMFPHTRHIEFIAYFSRLPV